MQGLKGRVAIVTGGAGLIGAAISQRLAAEGATVVVASRNAEEQIDTIRKSAGKVFGQKMDLADEAGIRTAFAHLQKKSGAPQILIANASLRDGLTTDFANISHQEFGKLFDVDVAGHFLLARLLAENLPAGQSGSIVFLSSIYAVAGMDTGMYSPGMIGVPPQYAAAKSALIGLMRNLASRWGGKNIRVNCIIAGGVAAENRQSAEFRSRYSEKTLLKRMARPEEIANAVAFLASDEASYITGACLAVDGGFTAW